MEARAGRMVELMRGGRMLRMAGGAEGRMGLWWRFCSASNMR